MYSHCLKNKKFVKQDNRKIFGVLPMNFLSEKYKVDVDLSIGDEFQHFSKNLSSLERELANINK